MNMFPVGLFLVLFAALYYAWFFYFRHFHIGFGLVLEYKESDGTVWVTSRLLKSPAGEAGVKLFSRVAYINGIPMIFCSRAEFLAWEKETKPKRKEESVYIFMDGETVRMTPVLIKEKVPVYWSPNMEMKNLPHSLVTQGVEWCDKTGQYAYTGRLSREVVRAAFYG